MPFEKEFYALQKSPSGSSTCLQLLKSYSVLKTCWYFSEKLKMFIFLSDLLIMLPLQQYPERCHTGFILLDSFLMFNLERLGRFDLSQ